MVDASHAGLDGLPNSARGISVDGYVSAPILCRLDRGVKFSNRVLRDIERVVTGGYATTGHQLDLAGTERQLLWHTTTSELPGLMGAFV
jgi:hypothetical protein